MWKELLDLFRQVITLHQDTQRNSGEIKATQQEVKELRKELKEFREDLDGLTRAVERLAFEIHRVESDEVKERKMMALHLENEMLRFERRLPYIKPGEE